MPTRIHRASKRSLALSKPLLHPKLRRRRVNDLFDRTLGRWPEMTQYAHDESTHELRIFRWNACPEEIASVRAGEVEIGFESYSDLCYLNSRLIKTGDWERTPVAHWLLPHPRCALPQLGSALRIILIDASDGKIKAIGAAEMGDAEAARLIQLLTNQAGQPSSYLTMDDQLRSTRSHTMQRSIKDRKDIATSTVRMAKIHR